MALYAFDGTWNEENPETARNTNVWWFHKAYQGPKRYWAGVGTRLGVAGKVAGGITGAGGHQRIREALVELTKNTLAGDTVVDIVGFSRGAAIAVDFANEVALQPPLPDGKTPTVRFLGVWDVVASFDLPGDRIDIGFNFKTPLAQRIVHCMALDERRLFFPLTRLKGTGSNEGGRLLELWFRGVHSDVGGGDEAVGLSSIALNFMFADALRAGLPLEAGLVAENAKRVDPTCPICIHKDWLVEKLLPFRAIHEGDLIHESVASRVDDRMHFYNNSGANLAKVDDRGEVLPVVKTAAG